MRKVTVIETAEELIAFASPLRTNGDDTPFMDRANVTLVIDGGVPRLQDKERKFQLSPDVTQEEIFNAMAKACHIKIYQT